MIKTKAAAPSDTTEQPSSFPVSLTLEELQAAVLDVFLHYIRTIARIKDVRTAWAVIGDLPVPEGSSLFYVDNGAAELGLNYEHIRRTEFARSMEYLYEFAFFGRLDESAESMFDESIYTWVAAIVCDAARGYAALEWDSLGGSSADSARKCVQVAELANARHMLEGEEPFFNRFWGSSAKDEAVGDDSLTVRQLALLSGMGEMSIRAAANPKRPEPLKTHAEVGGTRIAFDVAKAWLQSKGRYVEITRYRSAGEVDLAKREFTSPGALIDALNAKREIIAPFNAANDLNIRLAELGVPVDERGDDISWNIDERHLHDDNLMRNLAALLELPADLLVLRTKQMLAIQQLSQIETQLQEATAATTKTNI